MTVIKDKVHVNALGTNHETGNAYFQCVNINDEPVHLVYYSIEGVDMNMTISAFDTEICSIPVNDHFVSGPNRVAFRVAITNASSPKIEKGTIYLNNTSSLSI